jgi:hypothetical protein
VACTARAPGHEGAEALALRETAAVDEDVDAIVADSAAAVSSREASAMSRKTHRSRKSRSPPSPALAVE